MRTLIPSIPWLILGLIALGGCGDNKPSGSPDMGLPDPDMAASSDTGTSSTDMDTNAPTRCGTDEHVVANACDICTAGTTNMAGDDPAGADTSCDGPACVADEYVSANTCVACDPGTTNEGGDDPAGADTVCDSVLCGVDEYVAANTCVACAVGMNNASGDDASGADTACEPVLCSDNEYVASNACVACAAGTENVAGDDATGADTACDAIFCAADEFVSANVCTTCPTGATNPAGDDASGPDTLCGDACSTIFGVTCDLYVQAYVKSSNTEASDFFGHVVAVSGDTMAVGAPYEDSSASGVGGDQLDNAAPNAGAVYVFRRTGTTWAQEAYVKASNPGGNDQFGWSVALSGDTLAVGAVYEDSDATGIGGDQANDAASESGAVYVFSRTGTAWTQQAYIKASNSEADDEFGWSLAIDGDTLAVGAHYESSIATGVGGDQASNVADRRGAVYVFGRVGATWTQQEYLKSSNFGGYRFGHSLALEGDTLAVGATGEMSNAVGVDGDQTNQTAASSGAVYVFTRAGSAWSQQAYVKASNTQGGDNFGDFVALSGDTLAVTAMGEASRAVGVDGDQADNSAPYAGAAYVFVRNAGVWSQQAYIKASNTRFDGVPGNDFFGSSVGLSGDTLAVGAFREGSNALGLNGDQDNEGAFQSGAVYLYRRSGGTWAQQAYIKASNTDSGDHFGRGMTLEGNTLAVGAPDERSAAVGIDGDQQSDASSSAGAVYVRRIAP